MIEDLRRELLALRERAGVVEHRLLGMVEDAPEAMLVVDGEGRLVFANRAADAVLDPDPRDSANVSASIAISGADGARRLGLRVVPSTWDGRAASLVILSGVTALTASRSGPLASDEVAGAQHGAHVGVRGATFRCIVDDLDRMASQFGASVGNDLAAEVDRRLRRTVRALDEPRRVGTSEFVVLCRGVDRAQASTVAHRLARAIEAPMTTAGIELALSATVTSEFADEVPARVTAAPAEQAGRPVSGGPGDKRDKLRGALFSGPGQTR